MRTSTTSSDFSVQPIELIPSSAKRAFRRETDHRDKSSTVEGGGLATALLGGTHSSASEATSTTSFRFRQNPGTGAEDDAVLSSGAVPVVATAFQACNRERLRTRTAKSSCFCSQGLFNVRPIPVSRSNARSIGSSARRPRRLSKGPLGFLSDPLTCRIALSSSRHTFSSAAIAVVST